MEENTCMEMYLSLGVSTIVALMAAHRTGKDLLIPATSDRGRIDRIGPGNFGIVPTDEPGQSGEAMRRQHGIEPGRPRASTTGSPAPCWHGSGRFPPQA
jgi:hypothetical protein